MELCSIASGSNGNCIFAASGDSRLLLDVGISGVRVEAGLHEIGYDTSEMDGILITHEHADHIKGLGVLSRRYGLPIYATKGTQDAITASDLVGEIDTSLFRTIQPDVPFRVGALSITPFSISHDAADPVAYILRSGSKSMAVVTDLGFYDDSLVERLAGLDVLLIEANHDVNMLMVGRYPYPLKQRIMSDRGHLSNEMAGRLVGEVLHDRTQHILLGHLSQENNYPELALESVRSEITMGENPYRGSDFPIDVAPRGAVSEHIIF